MSDSIVNKWLFVRYMVIGVYVGCVTVAGFAWWYMFYAVRTSTCCTNLHACRKRDGLAQLLFLVPDLGCSICGLSSMLGFADSCGSIYRKMLCKA